MFKDDCFHFWDLLKTYSFWCRFNLANVVVKIWFSWWSYDFAFRKRSSVKPLIALRLNRASEDGSGTGTATKETESI